MIGSEADGSGRDNSPEGTVNGSGFRSLKLVTSGRSHHALNHSSAAAGGSLNSSICSTTSTSGEATFPPSSVAATSDYSSGEEVPSRIAEGSADACATGVPAKRRAGKSLSAKELLPLVSPPVAPHSHMRVYKLVLTGGPCGGKTTGQDRLASFFEHMGWKVFTVPECATVLLGGGVRFPELSDQQRHVFQRDLLLTLLQIEKVFFNQAELMVKDRNVLIICDRGAMDPSAYLAPEEWEKVLKECDLSTFDLRENRYDQIVHMVTAADGADGFYTLKNNNTRSEGIHQAIEQDRVTRNAWLGHPYVDIVDNSCDSFNAKILQLVQVVCERIGIQYQDRLAKNSRKRKWLVNAFDESLFTKYEEFSVRHDYLLVDDPNIQVRIRRRSQHNRSTYTLTTRRQIHPSEWVETRMQLPQREYNRYIAMKDKHRCALHKRRRCFTHGADYFHLDIYVDPLPPAFHGRRLMVLETYTTKPIGDPKPELPPFLAIEKEITDDHNYSMYNLAKLNGATFDDVNGEPPNSHGKKATIPIAD